MATVIGSLLDDEILPTGSSAGVSGIVTDGADHIIGNLGADTIDGGDGADTIMDGAPGGPAASDNRPDALRGGDGADSIVSDAGRDTIWGDAGADTIIVAPSSDQNVNVRIFADGLDSIALFSRNVDIIVSGTDLTGLTILANNPRTTLVILASAPVLIPDRFGFMGIDELVAEDLHLRGGDADNNIDLIAMRLTLVGTRGLYEAEGGNDTVTTTRGTPLILDGGAGNDSLTGFDAADSLIGGVGDDTLDGARAADTLAGGTGNDLYLLDHEDDRVIERGLGADTVRASADHALGTGVEVLALGGGARRGTGNALANLIIGTTGNDSLDGDRGDDTLRGGAGNDLYRLDASGDRVEDSGGADTVLAAQDHTLGAGIEALSLLGAADLDGTGNGLANRLVGNAGANSLRGLDGADTLDGRGGADTMEGGGGHDRYLVDHAGDVLVDAAGIDTVLARLDWTLATGFERLTLLGAAGLGGTGNAANNVLVGNAGANSLAGLGGHDLLDGRAGADTMDGGAGNDTLVVDHAGDVLLDAAGIDLVRASRDWVLGADFENLELLAGAVSGTGNGAANRISGNAALNALSGGAGADTLLGGGGPDFLTGGPGADLFLQPARGLGTDELMDFVKGEDRIGLSAAAFGLPVGDLPLGRFFVALGSPSGTAPAGTAVLIGVLPNPFGGSGATREELWFDPDGGGPLAPERLFVIGSGTTLLLGAGDILVV
jgi:Ca2+-binding RTX toxin-like protein